MHIDALLLLSDAQAFTGAATVSTNTVDLLRTTPDQIGTGEPIGVAFQVDVAAGAGSTATLEIITSAAANLSSPTVIATLTLLAAALPAGALMFLTIPPGFPLLRYLGIRETSTGGTTTITLTSWVAPRDLFSIQAAAYAKNYAV